MVKELQREFLVSGLSFIVASRSFTVLTGNVFLDNRGKEDVVTASSLKGKLVFEMDDSVTGFLNQKPKIRNKKPKAVLLHP